MISLFIYHIFILQTKYIFKILIAIYAVSVG